MKKIINPFVERENYNCFGCSPNNKDGLQMSFYEDGDFIISIWEPKKQFEGFTNVLHGGIQATLMDEIASWVVFVKLGTSGVTSKLEVKYKKPVYCDKGKITLKARNCRTIRNLAEISVELFDGEGELCSSATVVYYMLKKDEAQNQLSYPGVEAFYEGN